MRLLKKILEYYRNVINRTISRKVSSYFIVIFLVIFLTSSYVSYSIYTRTAIKRSIASSESLIDAISSGWNILFTDLKSILVTLSVNESVLIFVRDSKELSSSDQLQLQYQIEDLMDKIDVFKPYIFNLYLVGLNGAQYSTEFAFNRKYDFFADDWFNTKLFDSKKGVSYTNLHRVDYFYSNPLSNPMVITAVIPIRNKSTVYGYVMCDIGVNQIANILDTTSTVDGENMFVMDDEGNIISAKDPDNIPENLDISLFSNASPSVTHSTMVDDKLYIYVESKDTGWNIITQIDYKKVTQSANTLLLMYFIIFLSGLLLFIFGSVGISLSIKKPLLLLINQMKRFSQSHKIEADVNYGYGEIAIIGDQFETMAEQINHLIDEVYIYEIRKKEMEYKNLVSQINPHFLYNVLQLMLTSAIKSGSEDMESMINELSCLMHYTMDDTREVVKLAEEIEYVTSYLNLYKRRFTSLFDYSISVSDNILSCKILKFLIQPIVENCFKHAFSNMKESAYIKIYIIQSADQLHITVYDNGKGISEIQLEHLNNQINSANPTSSIGLRNIHQRIRLKYGEAYFLKIDSIQHKYTKIDCIIPYNE